MFVTNYKDILNLVENIHPLKYAKSRNYIDGDVTRLSPYVSRGVISTKQILNSVLQKGYQPFEIEVFLKELAWREYFQRVWIAKGNEIDNDIKFAQEHVINHEISSCIIEHRMGIEALDKGIEDLYATGYLHNHLRMYIAKKEITKMPT